MENIDLPILTPHEKEDWLSLKPCDCDFQDYVRVDNDLTTCEVQSIDQIFDQESPATGNEMSEVADEEEEDEEKITFMQAVRGLETARKYFQQFHVEDSVFISCSDVENKLYAVKQHGNTKQMSILDWVKK